jgi:hypothetical protein
VRGMATALHPREGLKRSSADNHRADVSIL